MEYINNKMNTQFSCDNSLHESRFKITLSFLRLGGVPLNVTSLSNVHTLYYTVGAVCCYNTFICALMDIFFHGYDLMQAMKKTRVLLACCLCVWMHLSLRYAKHKLTIYSNVSKILSKFKA